MLDQIKNNLSNSISSKYNEILLDLEKIFEKIKKELITKKAENLVNLKVWEIDNQHLIHGFAWIATYLESLRQINKWAFKLAKNKNKSEFDINDSDVSNLGGHVLLVPNTGSCHSRVMMMSSESDWRQLLEFEKSRTFMHNCQREAFMEKLSIIKDMNALIDSAKFVSEVEKYWTDLRDCVDLHNQEIGQELSIVSNETKERLSNFSKIRQANREILAVVSKGVANDTNS